MTYALEVRCSIQLSYGCIIEGYPYDEHPSVPFNQLRPDLRLGFYFLLPQLYYKKFPITIQPQIAGQCLLKIRRNVYSYYTSRPIQILIYTRHCSIHTYAKYTPNIRQIYTIYRHAYTLIMDEIYTKNKRNVLGSERSERIMDEIYAIYTRIIHE